MILNLPPTVRVFLGGEPIDLRKSFDGLAAAVSGVLRRDPLSGHLFVFVNRRADRIKVIWYDSNGFALFYKRLERGRYHWLADAQAREACTEIRAAELALILQGIDLRGARRRRAWSPQRRVTSLIREASHSLAE